MHLKTRLPQLLGFSGLLPMAGILGGGWLWPDHQDQWLFFALLYVGSIFSFLGGIQWGLAIQREVSNDTDLRFTTRVAVGVAPSLITFTALILSPIYGGVMLFTGLWLLLAFEWQCSETNPLPTWYLPLRLNLTLLLSSSLIAALWFFA